MQNMLIGSDWGVAPSIKYALSSILLYMTLVFLDANKEEIGAFFQMAEEPTSIFADWKKNIDKILQKKRLEGETKRCPKCKEMSLAFDIKQGRIYCTRCGFEEYLIQ